MSATIRTAKTRKTRLCAMAGSWAVASSAVVAEMVRIEPDWRNMPRSPAIAATWSGASCSVALLVAGTAMPMPSPVSPAAAASHP